jgi:hypothetical protein
LQADRELKHKSVSVKLSDIFLLFGEWKHNNLNFGRTMSSVYLWTNFLSNEREKIRNQDSNDRRTFDCSLECCGVQVYTKYYELCQQLQTAPSVSKMWWMMHSLWVLYVSAY